mmetsp:Transcript_35738/g.80503  ORF Transcript_35738/g.80503 Transcript_35738/m.80503 type:complete len:86 (+) Transcript_35738:664-921(+)
MVAAARAQLAPKTGSRHLFVDNAAVAITLPLDGQPPEGDLARALSLLPGKTRTEKGLTEFFIRIAVCRRLRLLDSDCSTLVGAWG